MKNILCLNNISEVGLKALSKDYQITKDVAFADAILVRSANMLEMPLPNNVLGVARAGAGVNNIPLDNYAKQGIVVFNTPGANANAVKELTIAGMLLASRDLYGGMKWVKDNKADTEIGKNMEKAKAAFAGREILGKTIGIAGLGAVGSLIAGAASGMGMKVVGYEPAADTIKKNRHLLPSDIVLVSSIEEIYAVADFISLNVPLLPATKGMINHDAFAKMKDGVVILNLARDAIVNDADLKVALSSNKVRKYVTDFPNFETANMEGVIAIPHLGASTEEAEDNCASMAVKQLVGFIENGTIANSVNFPNIDAGALSSIHRVLILSENKEGLASEIIKAAEANAKVSQSISKAKGAYTATIIDFDKPKAGLEERLRSFAGVIRVRAIR